jgi:hypothetical protein
MTNQEKADELRRSIIQALKIADFNPMDIHSTKVADT